MADALAEVYGNASSIHYFGQRARQRVEAARRQVAERLGCLPQEVVFTSGGTESDNLAIFGVARLRPGCHIVTSLIEHPAVLAACERLERDGHPVTYVAPGSNGIVQEEAVRRLQLLTSKPVLYVCNVEEASAAAGNAFSAIVEARAKQEGASCVIVSAAIEA